MMMLEATLLGFGIFCALSCAFFGMLIEDQRYSSVFASLTILIFIVLTVDIIFHMAHPTHLRKVTDATGTTISYSRE